jgi:hypothetical protein
MVFFNSDQIERRFMGIGFSQSVVNNIEGSFAEFDVSVRKELISVFYI